MATLTLQRFSRLSPVSSANSQATASPANSANVLEAWLQANGRKDMLDRPIRALSDAYSVVSEPSREPSKVTPPSFSQMNDHTIAFIDTFEGYLDGDKTESELHQCIKRYQWMTDTVANEEDHVGLLHYLSVAADQRDIELDAVPHLSYGVQKTFLNLLSTVKKALENQQAPRAYSKVPSTSSASRSGSQASSEDPFAHPSIRDLAAQNRIPMGAKSKALRGVDSAGKAIKLGSYVTCEQFPEKTWRVSPTFAAGGFKKARVTIDENNERGVFVEHYLEGAPESYVRKRNLISFPFFERSRDVAERMQEKPFNTSASQAQFLDEKMRIWTKLDYYPTDLFAELAGKRDGTEGPAILHYLQQMTSTVGKAHKANDMLLDIKPENFLVASDYTLVFLDTDFAGPKETLPEDVFPYTRGYAAPEILLRNGADVSLASDIFSLGKTFITLLTAQDSDFFSSEDPRVMKADLKGLKRFLEGSAEERILPANSSSGSFSGVYRELAAFHPQLAPFVFERMLHKKAAQRATIGEVQEKLEQIAKELDYSNERIQKTLEHMSLNSCASEATKEKVQRRFEQLEGLAPTPSAQ